MKLWTLQTSSPRSAVRRAQRAEESGWHGIGVTDSQNLAGDPWVALAAMAVSTERIELGTAVTNPVTRHPAVTAAAAQSVAVVAGDRVTVGIGRGDSALAHLGRAPVSVAILDRYVRALRAYLGGGPVAFDDLGFSESTAPDVATLGLADTPVDSRLAWRRDDDPAVPVEVAATGPKVIASAAVTADRIVFALGADERRLAWGIETAREARTAAGLDPDGIEYAAYLNIAPHPDTERARALVAGGLTTFARFSVMHGTVSGPADDSQREVMERLHQGYDMTRHTRADSSQATVLTDDFIDGYAIVGPPDHCTERLQAIEAVGIDKAIVIGPGAGSDKDDARLAERLMASEILPVMA